jgi:hypothetical protein
MYMKMTAIEHSSTNKAIGLLDECLTNGDLGKENLYSWFLSERDIIEKTLQELEEDFLTNKVEALKNNEKA